MAEERKVTIEVPVERMESHLVTRRHLDAKYLKGFVEKMIKKTSSLQEAVNLLKLLQDYQNSEYQDESVVFRILILKAKMRVDELSGNATDNFKKEELERLEKLYANEDETKVKNIISRMI